jgi:cell division protein FtsI (penicillin-binding protein 3)
VEKHQAKSGGAGVINAVTGEILAIANYPSFDPNYLKKSSTNRRLNFITDPFEPGSVFKTFTVISAMENNIIKDDTNYFCENGKMKVGKHWVKESDSSHKFEWLSVKDILKYSSNVGTTKLLLI